MATCEHIFQKPGYLKFVLLFLYIKELEEFKSNYKSNFTLALKLHINLFEPDDNCFPQENFPGGPVVKTLSFHCKRHAFFLVGERRFNMVSAA